LTWLKAHENADGSWSDPKQPALTALPLIAFLHQPAGEYRAAPRPVFFEKGHAFLRAAAKPGGAIFDQTFASYNTSICLSAFLAIQDPADDPIIAGARDFVVNQQNRGQAEVALNGGFGESPATGSSPKARPDLDRTLTAIEALRVDRSARPDVIIRAGKDLNWKAAIAFISRCQNLATGPRNAAPPDDRGGFVFAPGFSYAAPTDGTEPLRASGSMTCAGLLALIFSDVQKDDPRVTAALEWLKKHHTFEENPGLGQAGRYYYLFLLARALAAAGIRDLDLPNGRKIDWAREASLKLLDLQNPDGSWVNQADGRWLENDPALVTSYMVITLELLYHRL
jgi:squalene-hopene/tetraprenyl-beta-curcumene cyclase